MKNNTQQIVEFYENIISVCSSVSIDNIIIEDGMIRGINDEKSCVILSSNISLSGLGSTKLGLARLSVLAARLSVLKNSKNFNIELAVNNKDEVTHIRLSGGGAKVDFRCAAPGLIRAPKAINDPPNWRLEISKEQAEMVSSAVRVMGAKTVVIAKKGNDVVIECSDSNNDVFSISLEKNPEWVSEETSTPEVAFAHYYPANMLLAVFKQKQSCELVIGENGTLTTQIGGHFLTIISKID